MLITRGFGTCTGTGTGANIYVPITDPVITASTSGKTIVTSSNKLPSKTTKSDSDLVPKVTTDIVDTGIKVKGLSPKLTIS